MALLNEKIASLDEKNKSIEQYQSSFIFEIENERKIISEGMSKASHILTFLG
jgi:hypothetical protein